MSKKTRRKFTADQKAAVVRHLVDKAPVSNLCEEAFPGEKARFVSGGGRADSIGHASPEGPDNATLSRKPAEEIANAAERWGVGGLEPKAPGSLDKAAELARLANMADQVNMQLTAILGNDVSRRLSLLGQVVPLCVR